MDAEYGAHYVAGNRNIHSNFLKAISFEIDKMRDKQKSENPPPGPVITADDVEELPESPLEAIQDL